MFPISGEEEFISTAINGLVLQVLLWGIYTVVYLGTVYVYLSKKSSKHWIIIGAISLSYCGYTADTLLVWYLTQNQFVTDSETRKTLFASLALSPGWLTLVTDIIIFVMAALADGILIWRCYGIWNRSIRAILLPAFLLFCEFAVDITLIILQCKEHFKASDHQAAINNHLIASQGFITFSATFSATFLIAYRIYTTSTDEVSGKSRRLFKQIVEILVQSAALYSVAALPYAVVAMIPETVDTLSTVNAAWTYASTLFLFAIGISPTLMVARVAYLDDSNRDLSIGSMRVSGLRFDARSATRGGSQLGWSSLELAEKSEHLEAEEK